MGVSLHQNILVLVQGGTNDESSMVATVRNHLTEFVKLANIGSQGKVTLHINLAEYLNNDLHTTDFMDYGGSHRFIAFYNHDFDEILVKNCGIQPYYYDYIIRVYKHPASLPTGFIANTWHWYNEYLGTPKLQKSYTSAIVTNLMPPHAVVGEVFLHEYCHQLQHRFSDVGINSIVDPDTHGPMQSNPLFNSPTDLGFYYKIMQNLLTPYNGIQAVPYYKLNGVAGKWI
jgi:hypothetical protein